MQLSQQDAPLVEALKQCSTRQNAAFYTPGHKRGQGISDLHRSVLGRDVFRADLPELPELDNLFAPTSVIAQAQELAAETFRAEKTWFLANGSTCGIEAAILATCGPGDKILIPRNVHRSVISGIILSGAMPLYLSPVYSPDWDLAWGVTAVAISTALTQYPDIKAVLIVSPTYQGICSDVVAIAAVVHKHNIPLIVDEAHGPHFAFHPDLPPSALASGADIVIQSTHKVLSALTQAAMMHVQGPRINHHRLSQALELTQSTSPSYLLLASLDAARHQMIHQGHPLMTHALTLATQARDGLTPISPLQILNPADLPTGFCLDLTRLTIGFSGLALTGFDADDWLHTQCSVTAELPSLNQLTFIISLGNTDAEIHQLIHALTKLTQHPSAQQFDVSSDQPQSVPASNGLTCSQPYLSPRDAFFAKAALCPIHEAIDQISADTICAYPPGIPSLLPGELITSAAVAELQTVLAAGGIVTGGQDPALKTLRIVRS